MSELLAVPGLEQAVVDLVLPDPEPARVADVGRRGGKQPVQHGNSSYSLSCLVVSCRVRMIRSAVCRVALVSGLGPESAYRADRPVVGQSGDQTVQHGVPVFPSVPKLASA